MSDYRDNLIEEVLASGESCPICHKDLKREMPMRALCTRMLVSRKARSLGSSNGKPLNDPAILCKNYLRGSVVCDGMCFIEASNKGSMDLECAIRVVAEGRAPDEKCEIAVLPPMSDSDFVDNVVMCETFTRIAMLVAQMRRIESQQKGTIHIADILEALGQVLDVYFHDKAGGANSGRMFEFPSPFLKDTKNARILDKCFSVFAVREGEKTVFEGAILDQLSQQLGKRAVAVRDLSPAHLAKSGRTLITFPLVIQSDGKKTVLRVCATQDAQYELV